MDFLKRLVEPRPIMAAFIFVLLYPNYIYYYGYQYLFIYNTDLPSFYSAAFATFNLESSPYDLSVISSIIETKVFPFLYPPPSLLLFYPFSLLTYDQTQLAMLILNHVLILFFIYIFIFHIIRLSVFKNDMLISSVIVFIFLFRPLVVQLNNGQMNLILVCLLCLFWISAKKNHHITASIILAFAIVLKTYPILIMFLLLFYKKFQIFFITMVCLMVITILALLFIPWSIWVEWLTNVLPTGGYGKVAYGLFSPAAPWNQSLNGLFSKVFLENPWAGPLIQSPLGGQIVTYFSSISVMIISAYAILYRCRIDGRHSFDWGMTIVLPVMYLVAPLSWEHHLVYVLPSILVVLISCLAGQFSNRPVIVVVVLVSIVALALHLPVSLLQFGLKSMAVLCLWAFIIYLAFQRTDRLFDTPVPRSAHE